MCAAFTPSSVSPSPAVAIGDGGAVNNARIPGSSPPSTSTCRSFPANAGGTVVCLRLCFVGNPLELLLGLPDDVTQDCLSLTVESGSFDLATAGAWGAKRNIKKPAAPKIPAVAVTRLRPPAGPPNPQSAVQSSIRKTLDTTFTSVTPAAEARSFIPAARRPSRLFLRSYGVAGAVPAPRRR
jgi:hypothetical protein